MRKVDSFYRVKLTSVNLLVHHWPEKVRGENNVSLLGVKLVRLVI